MRNFQQFCLSKQVCQVADLIEQVNIDPRIVANAIAEYLEHVQLAEGRKADPDTPYNQELRGRMLGSEVNDPEKLLNQIVRWVNSVPDEKNDRDPAGFNRLIHALHHALDAVRPVLQALIIRSKNNEMPSQPELGKMFRIAPHQNRLATGTEG